MKDVISKFRINPDSDLGKQMIKYNIMLEDAIAFEFKPEMMKVAGHYYNGVDLEPWKQSYFATGRADIVVVMKTGEKYTFSIYDDKPFAYLEQ